MAKETTVQTTYIEADECCENIAPGVTAAARKLKINVGEGIGCSSAQPSGEHESLSDTCTFSTPAPSGNGGVKAKSRISGLQSALTPILKFLNISNKSSDPSSQHPTPDIYRSHFGLLSGKDASVSLLEDEYLPEITLLDATCDSTMQLTRNDSALPDSVPATPVTARSVSCTLATQQPFQLSSSKATGQVCSLSKNITETSFVVDQNSASVKAGSSCDVRDITFDSLQKSGGSTILEETRSNSFCLQKNTLDTKIPCGLSGTVPVNSDKSESTQTSVSKPTAPEICDTFMRAKNNNSEILHLRQAKHNGRTANLNGMVDEYFPEITLLDVTHESELSSGGEIFHMEVTQGSSPGDKLKSGTPTLNVSGQIMMQPGRSDITQEQEDFSSTLGNLTHTIGSFSEQSKCVGENVTKASITPDISVSSVLENSQTSAEPSEENIVMSQPSADTLGTHPANVTQDLNPSGDISAQSAISQASPSDSQSNSSSKTITSELHDKPVGTSNPVEVKNEELLTTNDTEVPSNVPQLNPATAGSANSTCTVVQPVGVSASTSLNTTTEGPTPQNKTLDLYPSDVNGSKEDSCTKEQASSGFVNATETSSAIVHNSSAVKSSGSCDVQNITFDKHSPQKSSGSTFLEETQSTSFSLQNTFDSKPLSKQNTITLSETSLSDGHQNTLDKSSPKVCDAATNPKENTSEIQPSELSKHNSTDSNAKTVDIREITFEVNPVVETVSETEYHESKDNLKPGQPVTDGLSDTLGHQTIDTGNDKANKFNLDDSLDLRMDCLVTSTPMTGCKMSLCTEREEGKIFEAQKKLYRDGPGKPVIQVQSNIPSNIICDRKTFLTQPAVKPLLMPLKATSQLLKCKVASALPGRREPSMSGLPMMRQRTQAESMRNTAALNAALGTSGISNAYSLRSATAGSKQPASGLPRPQLSAIPTGNHIPAPGLRPPCARSNAPVSCTDKLHGLTVAKKHSLTRGESLPTAKRKKMEAPLPSDTTGSASHDATNGNKNPTQPIANQRRFPAKSKRGDAAVSAGTAETSTSCNAASRTRAQKQPAISHRAQVAKPQSHECAKCVRLEEQLKMKSEEIERLKALLKCSNQEEEC